MPVPVLVAVPTAGWPAAATEDVETTGVMVTPVTSPVIADFCFLPVVPRALRVALAFAVAAARASADRGLGDFFGEMARRPGSSARC